MSIKIKISGDGLEFEGETQLFRASQIIAFLSQEGSEPAPSLEKVTLATPIANTGASRQSPREALDDAQAKSYPQKITVLGFYLMLRDNAESFSATEVRELLKKSGEPLPGNFARDLKTAKNLGWIYSAGADSDSYYVTQKGKEAVTSQFTSGASGGLSSRKTRKKIGRPASENKLTSVASSRIRDVIKSFEIPTDFNGLSYWGTPALNKQEKILWLLAVSDQAGHDSLTAQEIEYLAGSRMLKDRILARDMNALTKSAVRNLLLKVNRDGAYQILQGGLEHLRRHSQV